LGKNGGGGRDLLADDDPGLLSLAAPSSRQPTGVNKRVVLQNINLYSMQSTGVDRSDEDVHFRGRNWPAPWDKSCAN
jgi:hypothetical protein